MGSAIASKPATDIGYRKIFGLKLGVDKKFRSPKEKHLLDIPQDLSEPSNYSPFLDFADAHASPAA